MPELHIHRAKFTETSGVRIEIMSELILVFYKWLLQPFSSFLRDLNAATAHILKATGQLPSVTFQRLLCSVTIRGHTNTPDL